MNYTKIMTDAKDLLKDPQKWNKDGDFFSEEGQCMCVMGAVAKAMVGVELTSAEEVKKEVWDDVLGVEIKLDNVVKKIYPDHPVSVIWFNDDEGTTHEELMTFMDIAIEESAKW